MQQASVQHLSLNARVDAAPAARRDVAPAQPSRSMAVAAPDRGEMGRIALSFLTVALIHAGVAALLITRTTEYTPINLLNPAASISIQATMVDAPEPEPIPEPSPEPPVLTSEQGEREIAPVPEKPVVEEQQTPPPVKKEVHQPPVKPVVKPQPIRPKTTAERQPAARPAPEPSHTAPEATPGTLTTASKGNLMQNSPGAQPKQVASVGCVVPQPDYPRRAKRLQQEGNVLVRLVISPEGRLIRHDIARSSGYDALDQAAIEAVAQARCTPYRENGQAITVMTIQPVNFRLTH
ncbi:energy transducer TonB [Pectobacterium atrosepticum]|uniref:energy transducer TonB n=1 Tax=Pectobacterium atrosepticum TaxID=29471 RepID=UPI0003A17D32|nr:energy transducer TonB [Pectobacterium atrosepticum]AIA70227.1 energy transducer TonB [Pectobacterium atrosepticum]AIK13148.1 TonB family protein [Pectobacterium atrosepticum]KFX16973.1 energy transducer TonB [Pectobacterium atrosepticum]KMK80789.1 TonB-like protein [Pectobacterium atrosepticum ICMP 1526]POW31041.1 cell envelope biogenesis protein TonB [Pectobacterium atrosepticum]